MFKILSRIAVYLIFAIQVSGCVPLLVGAAAGAGGVIWATGKLQQDLSAPLDHVHKATLAGLKELELPVLIDRKDKLTGKVESEYADGKHVWIDTEYVTKSTTKISVRVGTLGDETRSREIMEHIIRHL